MNRQTENREQQKNTASRLFIKIQENQLTLVLFAIFVIRIASLGAYPLPDNTEARYAEVAREMVTSGEWVTPHLHGEKYWSKPPLSIWLTASAMKLFGINEFSARLPHFLLALVVVGLIFSMAMHYKGRHLALASAAILSSSLLFFVGSSAVMTDMTLTLGTTLSMVSFWQAMNGTLFRNRVWGYLFFVGLIIGLLAKGPVCLVYISLPIVLWVVWKNKWRQSWYRLPWIGGLLLTVVLTLPWYLVAEKETPGFINYFIIGEHFLRFIKPGWSGDMYGVAHIQPRGTIWLFWLIAAFPWSLVGIGALLGSAKSRSRIFLDLRLSNGFYAYLLCWSLAPMLFFTMAGNILWTYILPGLPAFAILMARMCSSICSPSPRRGPEQNALRRFLMPVSGLIIPVLLGFMVTLASVISPNISQKALALEYLNLRPSEDSRIVYLFTRPFSAEFYTAGLAVEARDLAEAKVYLNDTAPNYFAIKQRHLSRIPENFLKPLYPVDTFGDFIMFSKKSETTS